MQIFPSTLAKYIAKAIDYASVLYLQQFTQAPPPFVEIDVDVSPFSYKAVEPGYVIINGGTVSAVVLTRGADTVTVVNQIVPVSIDDTVTVTYSVLPTMKFVPIYGAAPR